KFERHRADLPMPPMPPTGAQFVPPFELAHLSASRQGQHGSGLGVGQAGVTVCRRPRLPSEARPDVEGRLRAAPIGCRLEVSRLHGFRAVAAAAPDCSRPRCSRSSQVPIDADDVWPAGHIDSLNLRSERRAAWSLEVTVVWTLVPVWRAAISTTRTRSSSTGPPAPRAQPDLRGATRHATALTICTSPTGRHFLVEAPQWSGAMCLRPSPRGRHYELAADLLSRR